MDSSSIESDMRLILLSGPIAVGKSRVAAQLVGRHDFERISSSAYLRKHVVASYGEGCRRSLQDVGDALDAATDFRWLIDDVALPMFARSGRGRDRWVLDAVRKQRQVDHFKEIEVDVRHVHLTASEATLRSRYEHRKSRDDINYDDAVIHPNERAARSLIDIADFVLSVEGRSSADIANLILGGNENAKDRPD